jgi:WD40 repeat protein
MPGAGCVSEADLRALLLGELPEESCRDVAAHLEVCPACETLARGLDGLTDPFVRRLLRAVVPGGDADTKAEGTPGGGPGVPPPARVAGYEVLGELGRGGMGVVYLARQGRPRRLVALKMILAGAHAGPERRARLLAEADAIARLGHPHIVQIYEAGEHDGLPFLALEHMPGGTLADKLAGRPQPPRAAADLAATLAGAIAHAHAAGVVHRDLKPANVLLTGDGTPKVSDFSLAKLGGADLTATGSFLGTPAYMAPEQAAGARDVGPGADVYALGAVLYELLTGRPPFQSATPLETLEQVRCREAVPVRHLQPRVPRDLETVCLKCLEKDPRKRYQTAADLADDLRRFLDGRAVRARPVGPGGRLWRWARRNPAPAALAAAVAGLLVVLAAGATGAAALLGQALRESRGNANAADRARGEAERRLGRARLEQARAVRRVRTAGRRGESLRLLREAAGLCPPEELRDEVIAALALTDLEEVGRAADAYPPGTAFMAEDLDGGRYAVSARDGSGVRVSRFGDSRPLFPPLPDLGPGTAVLFSPDGRFLLQQRLGAAPRAGLWDLSGPRPRRVAGGPTDGDCWAAAFRPGGRLAALRGGDGSVRVVDADGREAYRSARGLAPGGPLALHPRLPRVAAGRGGDVVVFDFEETREVARLPHRVAVESLDWGPDGRLLAAGCRDGMVCVWDAAAGRPVRTCRGHSAPVAVVSFHPAAPVLASCDAARRLRLWDLASGAELAASTGNAGPWSAGAEPRIYQWSGADLRFLRLAPQRVLRRLGCGAAVGSLLPDGAVLDPSGRWLACGSSGGTFLTDLADPAGLPAVCLPGERPVGFEPSGALLTAGEKGLLRRGALAAPGGPGTDSPEVLLSGAVAAAGCSADGAVAAAVRAGAGPCLWRRDRPAAPLPLGPQDDVGQAAVSPDGGWAVTGSANDVLPDTGAKIWDAATGRLAHVLPVACAPRLRFSPDGRWLATTDLLRSYLWRVGTWEPGPRFPGKSVAFGPAGLAAVGEAGVVRLVDPETGAEYARLDATDEPDPVPCCFSRDGALLVALGRDSRTVLLWDLRELRRELAGWGLDWDGPPASTRLDAVPPGE